MEVLLNSFMDQMRNTKDVLSIEQIVQNISHHFQNISSADSSEKSAKDGMKVLSDCSVRIKRMQIQDIIRDYNIDYLGVKKYYELESEEECDYNIINNNIYNKCNQNESCVRLENLFDDELIEQSVFETSIDTKPKGKKRGRKPKTNTSEKSKKKQKICISHSISDHLKRSIKRSNDGNFVTKTIVSNDNNNANVSHKQEVIVLKGTNNVVNIINNKKIEKNSVKNKKKSTKTANNKKKTFYTSTPITVKQDSNKSLTPNNCCNNLFNSNGNYLDESEFKTFMGTRYVKNDLLYKCNDCENGCEIDELTLACHLLITSPKDQLPNDLKVGFNLDEDSTDDSNDESVDNVINSETDWDVLPNINDIYQQTIEDDNQLTITPIEAQLIDNFLINTQLPNNIPFFDPLMPSTSGYSLNSNHMNSVNGLQEVLELLPEDLSTVTPLRLNTSQALTTNSDPLIKNNPMLSPSLDINVNTNVMNSPYAQNSIPNTSTQVTESEGLTSLTAGSSKKVVYQCVHCMENFPQTKLLKIHCNDFHPELPKCWKAFSPKKSPHKSSPITTTTASTLNFNVNSGSTQVFILNEPQNISITPSSTSIRRQIEFTND